MFMSMAEARFFCALAGPVRSANHYQAGGQAFGMSFTSGCRGLVRSSMRGAPFFSIWFSKRVGHHVPGSHAGPTPGGRDGAEKWVAKATPTWQCFVDILAGFVYPTITMAHGLDYKQKVIRRPAEARRRKRGVSLGASLGLPALGIGALIEEIQTGLPFKALVSFSFESGISISEIASVIEVSERTLARRKALGRFSPAESERLLRLSNVFEKALGFFEGDVKGAVAWLRSPNRALGHKTPFTYARTEIGARQVEDLIGRLAHGVFV